jgi:hypothetical protein
MDFAEAERMFRPATYAPRANYSHEFTLTSDYCDRPYSAVDFLEPDPVKASEAYTNLIHNKAQGFSDNTNIEVSRLSTRSEVPITVVGQVVHGDEKLVRANVSLKVGNDKVQLNLDYIQEYFLFPGQIVPVTGTSDGEVFYAQQIHKFPYSMMERDRSYSWRGEQPIKCAVIRGPFSHDGDLEFEPLLKALKHIEERQDSIGVAVLIGPFVDADSSTMESGEIHSTLLNINDGTVRELMTKLIAHIESKLKRIRKIVLIPSLQDIATIDPLPQFFDYYRSENSKVIVLSNPCSFRINDLEIGVLPFDVIRELAKETLFKYPGIVNKIEMALNQVIEQRSFCPIYPSSIPIDIGKIESIQMKSLPNALLVGTSLGLSNYIDIQGVRCINSRTLINKKEPLNAVLLTLYPPSRVTSRVEVDNINIY